MISAHGEPKKQGIEGNIPVRKLNKHQKFEFDTILCGATYDKGNTFNLFGVNGLMDKGWTAYGNNKEGHCLTKDGRKVRFDIQISTAKGCVWCDYFERVPIDPSTKQGSMEYSLANATCAGTKINLMEAHQLTGHHNDATTRAIAKI